MRKRVIAPLLGLGLLVAGAATATAQDAKPAIGLVFKGIEDISETSLQSAEALAEFGHPNELWRIRAMMALKRGDVDGGLERLRMAARYADKLSQHSLALMYWHGVGVQADRARAWAWNDLAAERGYPSLEQSRTAMWSKMSEDERQRGAALRAELAVDYADAVAQPRMELALSQAKKSITGSHLGSTINQVQVGSTSMRRVAHQDSYYAPQRWNAEEYWQGEARVWKGKVIVRDTEKVTDTDTDTGTQRDAPVDGD
ncbi:sel1 repeat family protein [Marilutibacter spongiae]|uniref:Sel1 repeat family protein n=1 Tax=Marilutibacter spongiae TaxID=2025720 RepID=A0A7W3TPC7_9GAMM|nr:sel1 repeat family protein [Lysobacter spongiae]MBB1062028.1 sel1 repeat family protein [Lysobacter spongiae]